MEVFADVQGSAGILMPHRGACSGDGRQRGLARRQRRARLSAPWSVSGCLLAGEEEDRREGVSWAGPMLLCTNGPSDR